MKNLLRQYVMLARTFSAEARKYRVKDRVSTHSSHFWEEYMRNRTISRAYLHAARLVKEEMASQAKHRSISRQIRTQLKAA